VRQGSRGAEHQAVRKGQFPRYDLGQLQAVRLDA
jgi:hypothetical protein